MSKMMLTGALVIHAGVGIATGLLFASIVGNIGGALMWLLMFFCGVLLYLVLVGAIGLFLTHVIGFAEEEDEYGLD
jgi:hypothetical protein